MSFAWIVSKKFHQGTINDYKFMFVDASQFYLCRNPTNCLLSMNKSAHRCIFCNESVKHDKSVGLTHSRVKTDIELLISPVFSAWELTCWKRSWKYVNRTEKLGKATTTLSLIWISFINSNNDFDFVGWIGVIKTTCLFYFRSVKLHYIKKTDTRYEVIQIISVIQDWKKISFIPFLRWR